MLFLQHRSPHAAKVGESVLVLLLIVFVIELAAARRKLARAWAMNELHAHFLHFCLLRSFMDIPL